MQQQQREEENPKIGWIHNAKFNPGWNNLQSLLKVNFFYLMFYETVFDFIFIVTLLVIVFFWAANPDIER
jgi:hypothetical protein